MTVGEKRGKCGGDVGGNVMGVIGLSELGKVKGMEECE